MNKLFFDIEILSNDKLRLGLLDENGVFEILDFDNLYSFGQYLVTDFIYKYDKNILVGYNNEGFDNKLLQYSIMILDPNKAVYKRSPQFITDVLITANNTKKMEALKLQDEKYYKSVLFYKNSGELDKLYYNQLPFIDLMNFYKGGASKEGSLKFYTAKFLNKSYDDSQDFDSVEYLKMDLENTRDLYNLKKDDFEVIFTAYKLLNIDIRGSIKEPSLAGAYLNKNLIFNDNFKNKFKKDFENHPIFYDMINSVKKKEINYLGYNVEVNEGGIHFSKTNGFSYKKEENQDYYIYNIDATSFYPYTYIQNGIFEESSTKKIKEFLEKRKIAKKSGDKKTDSAYKLVLNSLYGKMFSRWDETKTTAHVTFYTQSAILSFIEKMNNDGFLDDLIDINTDGIIIKSRKKIEESVMEFTDPLTKLIYSFEVGEVDYLYYKDSNNYIVNFVGEDKTKYKGSWVENASCHSSINLIFFKNILDGILKESPIEEFKDIWFKGITKEKTSDKTATYHFDYVDFTRNEQFSFENPNIIQKKVLYGKDKDLPPKRFFKGYITNEEKLFVIESIKKDFFQKTSSVFYGAESDKKNSRAIIAKTNFVLCEKKYIKIFSESLSKNIFILDFDNKTDSIENIQNTIDSFKSFIKEKNILFDEEVSSSGKGYHIILSNYKKDLTEEEIKNKIKEIKTPECEIELRYNNGDGTTLSWDVSRLSKERRRFIHDLITTKEDIVIKTVAKQKTKKKEGKTLINDKHLSKIKKIVENSNLGYVYESLKDNTDLVFKCPHNHKKTNSKTEIYYSKEEDRYVANCFACNSNEEELTVLNKLRSVINTVIIEKVEEQYKLEEKAADCKFVIDKSDVGTGKTYAMCKDVKNLIESGEKCFIIGNKTTTSEMIRNQLLELGVMDGDIFICASPDNATDNWRNFVEVFEDKGYKIIIAIYSYFQLYYENTKQFKKYNNEAELTNYLSNYTLLAGLSNYCNNNSVNLFIDEADESLSNILTLKIKNPIIFGKKDKKTNFWNYSNKSDSQVLGFCELQKDLFFINPKKNDDENKETADFLNPIEFKNKNKLSVFSFENSFLSRQNEVEYQGSNKDMLKFGDITLKVEKPKEYGRSHLKVELIKARVNLNKKEIYQECFYNLLKNELILENKFFTKFLINTNFKSIKILTATESRLQDYKFYKDFIDLKRVVYIENKTSFKHNFKAYRMDITTGGANTNETSYNCVKSIEKEKNSKNLLVMGNKENTKNRFDSGKIPLPNSRFIELNKHYKRGYDGDFFNDNGIKTIISYVKHSSLRGNNNFGEINNVVIAFSSYVGDYNQDGCFGDFKSIYNGNHGKILKDLIKQVFGRLMRGNPDKKIYYEYAVNKKEEATESSILLEKLIKEYDIEIVDLDLKESLNFFSNVKLDDLEIKNESLKKYEKYEKEFYDGKDLLKKIKKNPSKKNKDNIKSLYNSLRKKHNGSI
jgi:hypothetical protein